MDIARPEFKKRRCRRQIIYAVSSLIGLALVTMGLQRLQPAAPLVENALLGTVERGPMPRKVHGNGTLVPEEIRSITAAYSGRIEELPIKVGAAVKANTVLVKLSNPELEQAAFDAEWTLKAAEAQLTNLTVTLASQKLTQQANVAMAEANYNRAKVEAEVNEELAKIDLVPALTLKQSKTNAAELKRLSDIEHERLRISADAAAAQLAVQEAQVRQLRAQLELKRQQVEALKVRAGIDGVLQRLGDQSLLQFGEQVAAGSLVARVTNPKKLMAELKIPETQARDVELEQTAEIDTRNGVVPGVVVREPTGNLDSKNGEAVMDLLRELHREGATICMVTHDPRFARYAERTVHLFDGRIVEESVEAGG